MFSRSGTRQEFRRFIGARPKVLATSATRPCCAKGYSISEGGCRKLEAYATAAAFLRMAGSVLRVGEFPNYSGGVSWEQMEMNTAYKP